MSLFDFFKQKTPEEKAAAHLEKMRRTEGERGFAAGAMIPIGSIVEGDISIVRLDPENEQMTISCSNRKTAIPYRAFRTMVVSSEVEIAEGTSPITLDEMNELLEGRAGLFVGEMQATAHIHARWFIRFTFEDDYGVNRTLMFMAYSMRGPYMASAKLHAATLFEETFADILERYHINQPKVEGDAAAPAVEEAAAPALDAGSETPAECTEEEAAAENDAAEESAENTGK